MILVKTCVYMHILRSILFLEDTLDEGNATMCYYSLGNASSQLRLLTLIPSSFGTFQRNPLSQVSDTSPLLVQDIIIYMKHTYSMLAQS